MASFTKEVKPQLAKRPLKTNGRLANLELTSLVKEATSTKAIIWLSHTVPVKQPWRIWVYESLYTHYIGTTKPNHERISLEMLYNSVQLVGIYQSVTANKPWLLGSILLRVHELNIEIL